MNKQAAIAIAAKYFPNYPNVSIFYVTDDGQVFEVITAAQNHANFLQKKNNKTGAGNVNTVTREDAADALKVISNPALVALQAAIDSAKADVATKRTIFDNASEDIKKEALASLEASEEALTHAENAYSIALEKK